MSKQEYGPDGEIIEPECAPPPEEVPEGTVGIKSHKHNEWLYAGDPMHESQRLALTWNGGGAPKTTQDMQWEIKKFPGGYFGIQSKKHNEWICAGNSMLDEQRRHVFTRGEGDPTTNPEMRWEIRVEVSPYHHLTIKSITHNEFMFAGEPMLDEKRRRALTYGGSGDPSKEEDMRWYICEIRIAFTSKTDKPPEANSSCCTTM